MENGTLDDKPASLGEYGLIVAVICAAHRCRIPVLIKTVRFAI